LTYDGGVIDVRANDVKDLENRAQIRSHFQHIAKMFANGDRLLSAHPTDKNLQLAVQLREPFKNKGLHRAPHGTRQIPTPN